MGRRQQKSSGGSVIVLLLLVVMVVAGCGYLVLDRTEEAPVETAPVVEEIVTTPEVTPVPEPEIEADPMPTLPEGTEDWQIIIASKWYPLDADPEMELATVEGYSVDSRIVEALEQMLADCRAAGFDPMICSAYRSYETQERLYENKVYRVMVAAPSLSIEEAMEVAATEVAVPGGSEHQTGLTLDIVDSAYQMLDDTQAETEAQQWLMEHCWEYGFILRYPLGYSDITGIIYEPWHYRYVGYDIAQEMLAEGVVLETYLADRGLYVFPEEVTETVEETVEETVVEAVAEPVAETVVETVVETVAETVTNETVDETVTDELVDDTEDDTAETVTEDVEVEIIDETVEAVTE